MSVRACALLWITVLVLVSSGISTLPSSGRSSEDLDGPAVIICSANGTRCWSEGTLLHSDGRCYAALTRGPCPDGQWWLADRNATSASARGKCAALPCPPDARSTACRRRMQRVADACPRLPNGDRQFAVHLDVTGHFRCGAFPGRTETLHAQIRCISLTGILRNRTSWAVSTNGRNCAQNNQGQCAETVEDTQPVFALNSED